MKHSAPRLTLMLPMLLTMLLTVLAPLLPVTTPAHAEATEATQVSGALIDGAAQLKQAALESRVGYEALGELCDNYGHRLSGSQTLEDAIDWTMATMREWGFTNVHKEPVQVPVWIRGQESLTIVSPARHEMAMLGLGRSVGTGPDGITAEVIRAESFDAFQALTDEAIRGRIVLFDAPYEGYGRTVPYRVDAASVAARRGAVAVLVRSVGLDGMRTAHTGAMRYAEDADQIPAAAISTEDANQIARMLARGDTVRAQLHMDARTLEDRTSHNVVGEIRGSTRADEVIVVGGHIDSWDVGQGAQDDGVGCLLAMEAVRLIHASDLRPARTLRVVLWTNEENGLRGGKAYALEHADDLDHFFAAMETDTGNGLISGFRFDLRAAALDDAATEAELTAARDRGLGLLESLAPLLAPLDAGSMLLSYSGADIGPLAEAGVPSIGVSHDTSEYFRIHHSDADTFDRINMADMQNNAAVLAIMLYALADMDASLRP